MTERDALIDAAAWKLSQLVAEKANREPPTRAHFEATKGYWRACAKAMIVFYEEIK